VAPANIAFIKYWGKRDVGPNIPLNNSISMNLDCAQTTTTVEFDPAMKLDQVTISGQAAGKTETERVSRHLDLFRKLGKINHAAKVESTNNFPKGAGIASSASGFAALSLAAASAAGLKFTQKQLSVLARQGSGSACRSVPDGFVEWAAGDSSESSFARSIFSPDYWNICDVIVIVSHQQKKISSTEGHKLARSSPFFDTRIKGMEKKVAEIKKAMRKKDFSSFGEIIEAEAINMHAVMMTSVPPLYYWSPETLEIIKSVIEWRESGLEAYFTIDAGPNVHIICQGKDKSRVVRKLKTLRSVIEQIIIAKPGKGARLI